MRAFWAPSVVGTTWVQQIVLLIHHDGDKSQLEGKHIFSLVPFIEAVEGMNKDKVCVNWLDFWSILA